MGGNNKISATLFPYRSSYTHRTPLNDTKPYSHYMLLKPEGILQDFETARLRLQIQCVSGRQKTETCKGRQKEKTSECSLRTPSLSWTTPPNFSNPVGGPSPIDTTRQTVPLLLTLHCVLSSLLGLFPKDPRL